MLVSAPQDQDNANAAAHAAPPVAHKFDKPDAPSVGEKWWHRLTYTGAGYAANLAVSVVLWDFFITGHGKPVYTGIQKGSAGTLKAFGMQEKQSEHMAESVAKYIFSPLGGHITMVPVKLAEDHARFITHRANQLLDPNYKYKDLQADLSTPDDALPPLSKEPNRNSWTQVYMRRGLGWAAVIASGVGLRASGMEAPLERNTLKAFNKAVDLTGHAGLKRLASTPGSRFQRYVQLTALDAYLTVVTSVITAVTKNTFGKSRDDGADDALSIDIPGLTEDSPELPATPQKRFTDTITPRVQTDNPLKNHENHAARVAAEPPAAHGHESRV